MIQITDKYKELDMLHAGLQSVKDLKGVKFAVIVSKNVRILDDLFKDIREASTPSEKFVELSQEIAPYVDKDLMKVKEIEEANKDLIEERKKQLDEVKALMEEECTVSLHPIPMDCLPEDISAAQVYNIDKLLE